MSAKDDDEEAGVYMRGAEWYGVESAGVEMPSPMGAAGVGYECSRPGVICMAGE